MIKGTPKSFSTRSQSQRAAYGKAVRKAVKRHNHALRALRSEQAFWELRTKPMPLLFDLVWYLNPSAAHPPRGRGEKTMARAIADLGRLILHLQALARRVGPNYFSDVEASKLQAKIRKFLHREENRIGLGFSLNGTRNLELSLSPSCRRGVPYAQGLILIGRLAATGDIMKLRRCDFQRCQKWYVARLKRQRFCSAACRLRAYFGTEEGKKKRAAYMRNYRSLLASGKVKVMERTRKGR